MKKLILSLSVAAMFAACSNPQSADTAVKPQADTSGLAAFNKWKQQQETFTMEAVEPMQTEAIAEEAIAPAVEKPKTVIVYRDAPAKAKTRAVAAKKPARVIYQKPASTSERVATTRNDIPPVNEGQTSGSGTGVGNGEGVGAGSEGDVATAPPAAKKEGWSKAAKGTAIGGASGAVLGAIISKNKTAGAVIGGVVGAAGGYVLGRKQDKKDGRY